MSAAGAARVAAIIQRAGQTATLRRIAGTTERTYTDVTVKASIRGATADDLIGDIAQYDSVAFISAAELAAAGWPAPPIPHDKLMVGTVAYDVQAVEPRCHGEQIALYVLGMSRP